MNDGEGYIDRRSILKPVIEHVVGGKIGVSRNYGGRTTPITNELYTLVLGEASPPESSSDL